MPKPETVQKALAEIRKSAANYRYFFENNQSPTWLAPLAEQGLFTTPPEKEQVEGGIIFPGWPASAYLARMARIPAAQEEVLKITLAMRDTDNPNIQSDVFAIALALPAKSAAKLAGRVRGWVQTTHQGIISYQVGDLIVHLANGGEANAALQLAKDTFALLPSVAAVAGSDAEWAIPLESRGWLEDWNYEEALKKAVPALVAADGRRALELFCELLARALELSRRRDDGKHLDSSYIWHPAIEEDEYPPRLRNSLISAVRNAAESFSNSAPENLTSALEVLRAQDWPVFERIEFHLLRKFADHALEQVVAVVPTLARVDGPAQHEAALLLKSLFAMLPAAAQNEVLRRIDEGPEETGVVRWLLWCCVEPTPAEIAKFGIHWRAQRFSLVADHVPEAWQARVRGVLADAGEVRPLDEASRVTTWQGPTSPKTAEDLAAMNPEGVVMFLREWSPEPGHWSSTPEGLGRVLQGVIARDPAGFIAKTEQFRLVDPTFVRFFFSGLETAIKESRPFVWSPVLSLARWVVEQPREIPGRQKAMMEADPGWQWTRGAVADLLHLGLQKQPGAVEYEDRNLVWSILEPLTNDPEPTVEYEEQYGGENMDPATMAINTVRGKAFNAVIQYALWVRRHLDRLEQRPPMTLEAMQEVQRVLDDHLDVEREPTLTIRSIYGRYFPWLQHLDRDWAQSAVERIFLANPAQAPYFDAAWETYITFCPAYNDVLPVLRAQYARAVAAVTQYDGADKRDQGPQRRLGEHLVAYYWQGRIRIDDELVTEFFRLAPDGLRGSAIEYVGRSLVNAPKQVADEILPRLRELWEWRLRTAQASGNLPGYRHELAKFGWWFTSRKFDDAWSLTQVRTILEATKTIEPDFKIGETLESLAPRYPLDCALCVTRLVQANQHDWTILANRDHFQAVLRTALGSQSPEARLAATRAVEYLVGRGHFEYRRLLS